MSSDEQVAIRISGLSKCYHIYDKPNDRLRQFVIPKLLRVIPGSRKHSCAYYREFWALKDVSFDIRKGETVGIIGRNGSGKSTLLQMICGTLNPSSGHIQTNGRIAALLELGSGFNPEFTGRENVYMNASVLGLTNQEIDDRFDDIVNFAEIDEFIEQPVKTYSSGMMVRLAFAVAITVKPDILVVDEALSVGDIRFQTKCMRAIHEIKEQGAAILFVTHSPGQIEALCNRAIWLNDGALKEDGLPKDLMRRYVNFMMHGIDVEKTAQHACKSENITKNADTQVYCWNVITGKNNIEGNQTAMIKRIMVRQENDEPANVIEAKSQKIIVTMEIEALADVYTPLLAVGLFNGLNEPIIHFNSENIQSPVSQLQAGTQHIFDIGFDVPALKPGDYLISVGIDDGVAGMSSVLCHVYDAWTISVTVPKYEKAQAGYFQIENGRKSIKQTVSE